MKAFFFILLIGLCNSCNIEKRIYFPGYHVERIHPVENSIKKSSTEQEYVGTSEKNVYSAIHQSKNTTSASFQKNAIASTREILFALPRNNLLNPDSFKQLERDAIYSNYSSNSVTKVRKATILQAFSSDTLKPQAIPSRKEEGFGLAGFLTGMAGLVIAGLPLGILSLAFGIISINRVRNHPQKFRGWVFGLLAILLGAFDIIGSVIGLRWIVF